MVEHRVIIVTLWVCVLSSIINVQLCHSKESRIAQYWCEFPPFLRSSAASEVGAANTALSHTTAPADGTPGWWCWRYVIPASPASVHRKKTLTTLNFAMVRSEKPVLPTVSEKKNTKTPACVMQSANSRSSVCVREQNFGFVYFAFFYYDDCELELERSSSSSSDGGAAWWPILLLTHVFAETHGRGWVWVSG